MSSPNPGTLPVITIVIPTFNPGPQLEQALMSVAAQTYPNIEALVMDGLSTDGTQQLLERYRHVLAKCVSEKDRGIYDAMNKALQAATGEWIYFMGADDVLYSPTALADVLTAERAANNDVVYADVYNAAAEIWYYHGELTERQMVEGYLCHQAVLMRTALMRKLGGFDTHYRLAADRVIHLQWFSDRGVRREYVHTPLCVYGGAGASAMSRDQEYDRRMLWLVLQNQSFPAFLDTLRAWTVLRTPEPVLVCWRTIRKPFRKLFRKHPKVTN